MTDCTSCVVQYLPTTSDIYLGVSEGSDEMIVIYCIRFRGSPCVDVLIVVTINPHWQLGSILAPAKVSSLNVEELITVNPPS